MPLFVDSVGPQNAEPSKDRPPHAENTDAKSRNSFFFFLFPEGNIIVSNRMENQTKTTDKEHGVTNAKFKPQRFRFHGTVHWF